MQLISFLPRTYAPIRGDANASMKGDLPIELPHKINLALNLTTAKAIGLTIPKEVLIKADVVFE